MSRQCDYKQPINCEASREEQWRIMQQKALGTFRDGETLDLRIHKLTD